MQKISTRLEKQHEFSHRKYKDKSVQANGDKIDE